MNGFTDKNFLNEQQHSTSCFFLNFRHRRNFAMFIYYYVITNEECLFQRCYVKKRLTMRIKKRTLQVISDDVFVLKTKKVFIGTEETNMLISTFSILAHIFQWLLEKNAEYLSETKHYYMEHCSIDII